MSGRICRFSKELSTPSPGLFDGYFSSHRIFDSSRQLNLLLLVQRLQRYLSPCDGQPESPTVRHLPSLFGTGPPVRLLLCCHELLERSARMGLRLSWSELLPRRRRQPGGWRRPGGRRRYPLHFPQHHRHGEWLLPTPSRGWSQQDLHGDPRVVTLRHGARRTPAYAALHEQSERGLQHIEHLRGGTVLSRTAPRRVGMPHAMR